MPQTAHPSSDFLSDLPSFPKLLDLIARGDAVVSTTLSKTEFYQTMPRDSIKTVALKHAAMQPLTLQELGAWYDNCTVGKYPGNLSKVIDAVYSANRCFELNWPELVFEKLQTLPKHGQAFLTFSVQSNRRITGHVLTTFPLGNGSVPLPAIILPKQTSSTIH